MLVLCISSWFRRQLLLYLDVANTSGRRFFSSPSKPCSSLFCSFLDRQRTLFLYPGDTCSADRRQASHSSSTSSGDRALRAVESPIQTNFHSSFQPESLPLSGIWETVLKDLRVFDGEIIFRLHLILNLLKRLLLIQVQAPDSGLMVTPNIIRGFQLKVFGSRHDKALTD